MSMMLLTKQMVNGEVMKAIESSRDHMPLINNNQDKHFKGQQANEEVVCFFRKHWIALLPTLVPFIFIMTVVSLLFATISFNDFFAANDSLHKTIFAILFVGTLLYVHRFFLQMINYFLHVVIITNQRVVEIRKTVYLHHSLDAVDLAQIQDLAKEQNGLVKNLLKFGELIITLSSTATTKTLIDVPKADFHFRVINRAMLAAKKGTPIRLHHGLGSREQEAELEEIAEKVEASS